MSYLPVIQHIIIQRGEDFTAFYDFQENATAIDLSELHDVTLSFFNGAGQVMQKSTKAGDEGILIAGAGNSELIVDIDEDALAAYSMLIYEIRFFFDADFKKSYVQGQLRIVERADFVDNTAREFLIETTAQ